MVALSKKYIVGVFIVVCCTSLAMGDVQDLLVRSEFDISLDMNWQDSGGYGDGYGGSWYYYPESERYIMWFDNDKGAAG